jgi:hypothetical protein
MAENNAPKTQKRALAETLILNYTKSIRPVRSASILLAILFFKFFKLLIDCSKVKEW